MEVDDDPVQVDVSDELLAGMDDESKKTLRDKVNAAATEAAKKKARRTSPPTKSSGATASAGGSGARFGPEQLDQMQNAVMEFGKALQSGLGHASGKWGAQSLAPASG